MTKLSACTCYGAPLKYYIGFWEQGRRNSLRRDITDVFRGRHPVPARGVRGHPGAITSCQELKSGKSYQALEV